MSDRASPSAPDLHALVPDAIRAVDRYFANALADHDWARGVLGDQSFQGLVRGLVRVESCPSSDDPSSLQLECLGHQLREARIEEAVEALSRLAVAFAASSHSTSERLFLLAHHVQVDDRAAARGLWPALKAGIQVAASLPTAPTETETSRVGDLPPLAGHPGRVGIGHSPAEAKPGPDPLSEFNHNALATFGKEPHQRVLLNGVSGAHSEPALGLAKSSREEAGAARPGGRELAAARTGDRPRLSDAALESAAIAILWRDNGSPPKVARIAEELGVNRQRLYDLPAFIKAVAQARGRAKE